MVPWEMGGGAGARMCEDGEWRARGTATCAANAGARHPGRGVKLSPPSQRVAGLSSKRNVSLHDAVFIGLCRAAMCGARDKCLFDRHLGTRTVQPMDLVGATMRMTPSETRASSRSKASISARERASTMRVSGEHAVSHRLMFITRRAPLESGRARARARAFGRCRGCTVGAAVALERLAARITLSWRYPSAYALGYEGKAPPQCGHLPPECGAKVTGVRRKKHRTAVKKRPECGVKSVALRPRTGRTPVPQRPQCGRLFTALRSGRGRTTARRGRTAASHSGADRPECGVALRSIGAALRSRRVGAARRVAGGDLPIHTVSDTVLDEPSLL